MHRDIGLEVPFEGALVDAMVAALGTARPRRARAARTCMSGGTDNKALAKLGITGYGFAPLRLPADLDFPAMFHGVDERVPLDALVFGQRVLSDLLRTTEPADPRSSSLTKGSVDFIEAIILGLVQGLTEFLPISSSAHLRIVGEFLPWAQDPGATFTAITQIGTETRGDHLLLARHRARSSRSGSGVGSLGGAIAARRTTPTRGWAG